VFIVIGVYVFHKAGVLGTSEHLRERAGQLAAIALIGLGIFLIADKLV
jgi:hypothetical protein